MKSLFAIIISVFVLAACMKNDSEVNNTTELCLDTLLIKTDIPEALLSVFFVNGKDGFVTGNKGGIYKTTDSAKHFSPVNSTVSLPIYSMFFVSSSKGFAVGGQDDCYQTGCVPPGAFILKTLDGGQTWAKIYTPSDKIELRSVFFINASAGFCVGDNLILKTSDGGNTWSEQKITGLEGKMMQVAFQNDKKGYIAGLFDKIIVTNDGGVTWQVTSPGRQVGYYSLSVNNSTIYIGGQGKIIKSTNGGASWNELTNSPANIYSIHFIDDKNGFAFGFGNYSGGDFGYSYGSIYCTNNGGNTWNGTRDVKTVGLISSASFPANNVGYAISGSTVIRLSVK